MECFLGTWELSHKDFVMLADMFELSLHDDREDDTLTKGYMKVEKIKNGAIWTWTYVNIPGATGTMTFDMAKKTYTYDGKRGVKEGTFRMEGDILIIEKTYESGAIFQSINKVTGHQLNATLFSHGDKTETLFKKCSE